MAMSAGTTFGGRYTLLDRIAVGGMGEVWRATDQVLGRVVAIKLLGAALADQPGFAHRFRDEARHTAALTHPNIAAVYDYGEDNGAAWLVMELVPGRPLSQIITDEAPLSPERTAKIMSQCADGLHAAHEAGVIHRDVKPANILVRPDGVVKITDFGIARAVDAAPLTRTGEVMGTAQYISPEQAMGQPVSAQSDVYSLACVAYEMLTGRRVFDDGSAVATAMAHVHKDPDPLPASVPPAIANVIMSALSKDPVHRPISAKAFAQALRGIPGSAYPATQAMSPQAPHTQVVPPPVSGTQVLANPTGYAAPPQPAYPQPPVAGPPTGATAYEEPRKRNSLLWIIPVALILAGLLGYVLMNTVLKPSPGPTPSPTATSTRSTTRSPSTSPSPSTATTSSTSTTSTRVDIDRDVYIGMGASDARAKLERLELNVRINRVDSDKPEGTVVDINPYGALNKGDTVTLDVSRGPQPTPTPTQSPTTEPSPSGTPSASSQASPSGQAAPGSPSASAGAEG